MRGAHLSFGLMHLCDLVSKQLLHRSPSAFRRCLQINVPVMARYESIQYDTIRFGTIMFHLVWFCNGTNIVQNYLVPAKIVMVLYGQNVPKTYQFSAKIVMQLYGQTYQNVPKLYQFLSQIILNVPKYTKIIPVSVSNRTILYHLERKRIVFYSMVRYATIQYETFLVQ